jgi:uncharacterized RmlC-like cupin family protein
MVNQKNRIIGFQNKIGFSLIVSIAAAAATTAHIHVSAEAAAVYILSTK